MTVDQRPPKPPQQNASENDTPGNALPLMRDASEAFWDFRAAVDILDTFVNDLSELAWAEGHRATPILDTQDRPFAHRNSLYQKLKRRGIDTSQGGWRFVRDREVAELAPPDYLPKAEIKQLAAQARELRERLERLQKKRNESYPEFHNRVQFAIALRRFDEQQEKKVS